MIRALQYIIKAYAFIVSPFLGRNCRFYPTCSSYAHQALEKHGVIKGLFLIISRIFACHPWSKRNFTDPVPSLFTWRGVLGYNRPTSEKQNLKGASNYDE